MIVLENLRALVSSVDHQFIGYISTIRSQGFVDFFAVITALGDWQTVIALGIIFSMIFYRRALRSYIIPLWVTLGLTEFVVVILKILVHRNRPDIAFLVLNDFSFPSAHAAIAVALYGFVLIVLTKAVKPDYTRLALITFAILLILLIGFSRIYLGVHYPSDVIGGYLVGLLIAFFGFRLEKILRGLHLN